MSSLRQLILTAGFLAAAQPAGAARVELSVTPVFNDVPLALDTLTYALPGEDTISVTRLSCLLSGFALKSADGSWQEVPDTCAWMDAAAGRRTVSLPGIPAGHYSALRFFIGPDAAANAADVARYPASHPLNPNLNGLHWSWQGEYIFLAVEGAWQHGGEESQGYSWHFAGNANRTLITLPLDLRVTAEAAVLTEFNAAALFTLTPRVAGNSTHSREGDPIAASLRTALPGAFRVLSARESAAAPAAAARPAPIDLPEHPAPFPLTISRRFPIPALPSDNPLLTSRVELGRRLFFDTAISRDGSISCASCHQPAAAFSDPAELSTGVNGLHPPRHSMPLFNLAWKTSYFWDGRAATLREQVLQPIADHREMDQDPDGLCKKLAASDDYPGLFAAAFQPPDITTEHLALALENYLLTLVSHNSRFDKSMNGQGELTEQEARGFALFFTEYEPRSGRVGADCFHCHGGADFSDHGFHNNGLDADPTDPGLAKVTGRPGDHARFATPSLRNVALTAPYMHDGRFSTLEAVLDHYASGVKPSASLDPNLAKHPGGGIPLSPEDKAAVIAFLRTLTDDNFARPQDSGAR